MFGFIALLEVSGASFQVRQRRLKGGFQLSTRSPRTWTLPMAGASKDWAACAGAGPSIQQTGHLDRRRTPARERDTVPEMETQGP